MEKLILLKKTKNKNKIKKRIKIEKEFEKLEMRILKRRRIQRKSLKNRIWKKYKVKNKV